MENRSLSSPPQREAISRDVALLSHLFRHLGEAVSPTVLAQVSGWSTAELPGRFRPFLEAGYPVETLPQGGIRLLTPGDIWCAEEILARATPPRLPEVASWSPLILSETGSTNDVARLAATQGSAPSGFLVAADRQTRGRGRLGRFWNSSGKGLYLSILLRPAWAAEEAGRLTILASVAAADAIESICGIRPQIKWPNDLFASGRKVGGLLIETELQAGLIVGAILGIGINVGQSEADFPPDLAQRATSLYLMTGDLYRRADLLIALLRALARRLRDDFAEVRQAWEESSLTLGQQIGLSLPGGAVRQGQALGLNEKGALLLRVASGEIETFSVGDMSVVTES